MNGKKALKKIKVYQSYTRYKNWSNFNCIKFLVEKTFEPHNMGHRKALTDYEQGQINAYHNELILDLEIRVSFYGIVGQWDVSSERWRKDGLRNKSANPAKFRNCQKEG